MGWNKVSTPARSPILEGIPQRSWFYFVHSYHVVSEEPGIEVLVSDYGGEFEAGVISGNLPLFSSTLKKALTTGS